MFVPVTRNTIAKMVSHWHRYVCLSCGSSTRTINWEEGDVPVGMLCHKWTGLKINCVQEDQLFNLDWFRLIRRKFFYIPCQLFNNRNISQKIQFDHHCHIKEINCAPSGNRSRSPRSKIMENNNNWRTKFHFRCCSQMNVYKNTRTQTKQYRAIYRQQEGTNFSIAFPHGSFIFGQSAAFAGQPLPWWWPALIFTAPRGLAGWLTGSANKWNDSPRAFVWVHPRVVPEGCCSQFTFAAYTIMVAARPLY